MNIFKSAIVFSQFSTPILIQLIKQNFELSVQKLGSRGNLRIYLGRGLFQYYFVWNMLAHS